jgi:hypothetical protein
MKHEQGFKLHRPKHAIAQWALGFFTQEIHQIYTQPSNPEDAFSMWCVDRDVQDGVGSRLREAYSQRVESFAPPAQPCTCPWPHLATFR